MKSFFLDVIFGSISSVTRMVPSRSSIRPLVLITGGVMGGLAVAKEFRGAIRDFNLIVRVGNGEEIFSDIHAPMCYGLGESSLSPWGGEALRDGLESG